MGFDPSEPRDDHGMWTVGMHLQAAKDLRVQATSHGGVNALARNSASKAIWHEQQVTEKTALMQPTVNSKVAAARIEQMDAVRQWGKVPTHEIFAGRIDFDASTHLHAAAAGAHDVQLVDPRNLVSVQRSVDVGTVKDKLANPGALGRGGASLPVVVEHGGVQYLVDGNHRAAADVLLGKQRIEVKYAKV